MSNPSLIWMDGTIWVGALVTLVVISYVFRDNPAYRLVQHAALGSAVGIFTVLLWTQVLWPRWALPMVRGFHAWRTEGLHGEGAGALWALALIPGSLWYFQLSKKYGGASTLITGLFVGAAAGLGIKYQTLLILPQISASIRPLTFGWDGQAEWGANLGMNLEGLNNLLFMAVLFAALLYFFFSIRTDQALVGAPLRFGRLAIMVALGVMFGNTVLTRMAYLLERLVFLSDWARRDVAGLFGHT